mgnify:CR=1 FL=1
MGQMPRKDYTGPLSALRILLDTVVAGNTVTINGLVYTAVAGAKADDTEFSIDSTDDATRDDLADSIDGDVRVGSVADAVFTVTTSPDVVVVTSTRIVEASTNSVSTIKLSGAYSTLLSVTSNVALNNEVLKRVNHMNSPYSVQATGADKLLVVSTAAIFNSLTPRTKVLWGNNHGYLKTITDDTSLVYVYKNHKGEPVETTKTMAEVIASGSMFIVNDLY